MISLTKNVAFNLWIPAQLDAAICTTCDSIHLRNNSLNMRMQKSMFKIVSLWIHLYCQHSVFSRWNSNCMDNNIFSSIMYLLFYQNSHFELCIYFIPIHISLLFFFFRRYPFVCEQLWQFQFRCILIGCNSRQSINVRPRSSRTVWMYWDIHSVVSYTMRGLTQTSLKSVSLELLVDRWDTCNIRVQHHQTQFKYIHIYCALVIKLLNGKTVHRKQKCAMARNR